MENHELPTSIPGFQRREWANPNEIGVGGRILSNQGDPVETHIHYHPDGVTLSTYRPGQKPERFTWGR